MLRALSVAGVLFLVACAGPSASFSTLEPDGVDLKDLKPIVEKVNKDSPAKGVVEVGDQIVEINGETIESRQDLLDYAITSANSAETLDQKVVLMKSDGERKEIIVRQLWNPFNKEVYVSFGGDDVVHKVMDAKEHFPLASLHEKNFTVVARLGEWSTKPQILEADIIITPHKDCHPCSLDGISLYSSQIEKELPLVQPNIVANMVYQHLTAETNPGQYVAVPPPTLAGFNSTTFTNGTVSPMGNQYMYNGTSTTTSTPVYDYSGQNAANMANAITSIRNSNAAKQLANRQRFIATHGSGTLKAGKLTPKEEIKGVLFFENIGDATGAFVLRIKHGGHPIALTYNAQEKPKTDIIIADQSSNNNN